MAVRKEICGEKITVKVPRDLLQRIDETAKYLVLPRAEVLRLKLAEVFSKGPYRE